MLDNELIFLFAPSRKMRSSRASRPTGRDKPQISLCIHTVSSLQSPHHLPISRSSGLLRLSIQLAYRQTRGVIYDPVHTPEAFSLCLLSSYDKEIVLGMCEQCCSSADASPHFIGGVPCLITLSGWRWIRPSIPATLLCQPPQNHSALDTRWDESKLPTRGRKVCYVPGIRFSSSACCVWTAGILG